MIGGRALAFWVFVILVGGVMLGWCAGAMTFEGAAR
jgi:hypothetical protein